MNYSKPTHTYQINFNRDVLRDTDVYAGHHHFAPHRGVMDFPLQVHSAVHAVFLEVFYILLVMVLVHFFHNRYSIIPIIRKATPWGRTHFLSSRRNPRDVDRDAYRVKSYQGACCSCDANSTLGSHFWAWVLVNMGGTPIIVPALHNLHHFAVYAVVVIPLSIIIVYSLTRPVKRSPHYKLGSVLAQLTGTETLPMILEQCEAYLSHRHLTLDHVSKYDPFSNNFWFRKANKTAPADRRDKHYLFFEHLDYLYDMPSVFSTLLKGKAVGALVLTTVPLDFSGTIGNFTYWHKHCWYAKTQSSYPEEVVFWNYQPGVMFIRTPLQLHSFRVTAHQLDERQTLFAFDYMRTALCFYNTMPTLSPIEVHKEKCLDGTLLGHRLDICQPSGEVKHAFTDEAFPHTTLHISHEPFMECMARAIRARSSNQLISCGELERVLLTHHVDRPALVAATLALWISSGWVPAKVHDVRLKIAPPTVLAKGAYEPLGPIVSIGKPTLVECAAPLIADAGVAPTDSINSDINFIEARVENVMNHKTPSYQFSEYSTEFIRQCKLTENGLLAPLDIVEVRTKQSKPIQKQQAIKESIYGDYKKEALAWQSFMKHESYCEKINDARAISSAPPFLREGYSRYTYALCLALKQRGIKWYAFGLNPDELSMRIHLLCAAAHVAIPTDYSRWDGRHSRWLAQFELTFMLACFHQSEHEEIKHWWLQHYDVKMVSKHSISYKNLFGRPSGSPDTSLFNTLCNAMLAYIVFREMGFTPEQAFERLGIYGGDDGITCDADPEIYERVAKECGLSLKAETLKTTDMIPFLGRYYLSPKTNNCSIIDLRRCMSKLHVTPDKNAKDVFIRKLIALRVTDPNTPLINTLLKKFNVQLPSKVQQIDWNNYSAVQAFISGATYPQDASEDQLIHAAAKAMKMDEIDFLTLNAVLATKPYQTWLESELVIAIPSVTQERVYLFDKYKDAPVVARNFTKEPQPKKVWVPKQITADVAERTAVAIKEGKQEFDPPKYDFARELGRRGLMEGGMNPYNYARNNYQSADEEATKTVTAYDVHSRAERYIKVMMKVFKTRPDLKLDPIIRRRLMDNFAIVRKKPPLPSLTTGININKRQATQPQNRLVRLAMSVQVGTKEVCIPITIEVPTGDAIKLSTTATLDDCPKQLNALKIDVLPPVEIKPGPTRSDIPVLKVADPEEWEKQVLYHEHSREIASDRRQVRDYWWRVLQDVELEEQANCPNHQPWVLEDNKNTFILSTCNNNNSCARGGILDTDYIDSDYDIADDCYYCTDTRLCPQHQMWSDSDG